MCLDLCSAAQILSLRSGNDGQSVAQMFSGLRPDVGGCSPSRKFFLILIRTPVQRFGGSCRCFSAVSFSLNSDPCLSKSLFLAVGS